MSYKEYICWSVINKCHADEGETKFEIIVSRQQSRAMAADGKMCVNSPN